MRRLAGRPTTHVALAVLALAAMALAAAPAELPPDHPLANVDPRDLVRDARAAEEIESWSTAAEKLRRLRMGMPADPDLDLWLCWFEARSGNLDAARDLIEGPILTKAADDSLPESRWQEYPWQHEGAWVNGRFDGWYWYVWRTRVELAALDGRWSQALAASRRATAARPLSGKEWWVRGLCAAHAGEWAEALDGAERARSLDPLLPEAPFLSGWLRWREGRRDEAVERFREALALDSTYQDAGVALVRARLPGSKPRSLPTTLFAGLRRAALLTSPHGPKMETFLQMDLSARVVSRHEVPEQGPTGAAPGGEPLRMYISFLLDEVGRVALTDVPHYNPEQVDPARVTAVIAALPRWEFSPAIRRGRPHPVWASQEFTFQP